MDLWTFASATRGGGQAMDNKERVTHNLTTPTTHKLTQAQ
jgi:hypothetical protein